MRSSTIIDTLVRGVVSDSASATQQLASELAQLFPADSVLALSGELGTGKTTFVAGLAQRWEIENPITSPTYNLLAIYQGTRRLIHVDAFRLQGTAEFDDLMIDDFLSSPYCIAIEWPENIGERLTDDCWKLRFEFRDAHRRHLHLEHPENYPREEPMSALHHP